MKYTTNRSCINFDPSFKYKEPSLDAGGRNALKAADKWKTENLSQSIRLTPQRMMKCNMKHSIAGGKVVKKKVSEWKIESISANETIKDSTSTPSQRKMKCNIDMISSELSTAGGEIDRPVVLEDAFSDSSILNEVACDERVQKNDPAHNDIDNEALHSTASNMEIKDVHAIERDVVADIRNVCLRFYEKHSLLSDDTRKELIKHIIDCIFNEGKLERPDLDRIAMDICCIYYDEDKLEYCNGRTGMLYNAYHSTVRKLRLKGILPKSKRALNKIIRIEEAETIENFSDSVIDSIEYLKSDNMDFDDCLFHWSNSYMPRMEMLKNPKKDLKYILNEWKVLELSMGHILINEDFQQTHGEERSESLCSKWASIFDEDKIKIIQNELKDISTKKKTL